MLYIFDGGPVPCHDAGIQPVFHNVLDDLLLIAPHNRNAGLYLMNAQPVKHAGDPQLFLV
jgi:hypothetical protein